MTMPETNGPGEAQPGRAEPGSGRRRPVIAVVALVVAVAVIGVVAIALIGASVARPAGPTEIGGRASDWNVTLSLDSPVVGTREAEIVVTDAVGVPLTDAAIVANATMPSMGHAGEVATGEPTGAGRYALSGDLFPMSGRWDVTVSIRLDGTSATATLPIVITAR